MNNNEDLTSDENLGLGTAGSAELERQFVRPGYVWRGLALRPYTAGTDLLFNQILDRGDAPFTIFLEFIFIHIEDREKLIELCWDKLKFREALLNWIDSLGELTTADKTQAMELFEEIRGWARKSSVEVLPDPELPQKKTTAKPRRRSRA
jgi:hypothetical protein